MIRRRAILGSSLGAFLGLLPAAILTSCAAPPAPAVLTLTVHAGADQNPDPSGRPAPVAVRLYQLSATGRFNRADVFALLEHQSQTLGTDALASEEFVLPPGKTQTITRTLQKGTQFIGIAVLFRDIDHATWRASAPVAASGPSALTLKISGLKVTLSSATS